MAFLSPVWQKKARTKQPSEHTARACRRRLDARMSRTFVVEQRHFTASSSGCNTVKIKWEKQGLQTMPTTAEDSVASAGGS